jgi:hypothetical protein
MSNLDEAQEAAAGLTLTCTAWAAAVAWVVAWVVA